MRLFELKSEPVEIAQAISLIKSSCGIALKAFLVTGDFLSRGIDSGPDITSITSQIFTARPRTDRQPSGLTKMKHKNLDVILSKLGFTALRRNSISCTSNPSAAEEFGDIFVIFPFDGFSFTWSKTIDDIGSMQYYKEDNNGDALFDALDDFEPGEISDEFVRKFNAKYKFTNQNFVAALKSGHEIAINGRYIAIQLDLYLSKVAPELK